MPQLRDVLVGRITAEQALAVVLAMLGLNATINVALAIPQSVADVRDQVAVSEWRNWLSNVAMLAAAIAVLAGIAAWLGPTVKSTSLISAFADGGALLCVGLMISIVQAASNAAEREMDRGQARNELAKLAARRHLLPVEFRVAHPPAPSGPARLGGMVGRFLLVVAFTAAVATTVVFGVAYFHHGKVLTSNPLWIFGVNTALSAVATSVAGFCSFNRWTSFRTNHPILRVYVLSWVLRLAYVFAAWQTASSLPLTTSVSAAVR
ncbi:hypothetical protein Ntsu_67930 [Nocardia sp. IFM 10818]